METSEAIDFLRRLKALHKTKKCTECEKLHGALAQLLIDAPILKFQIEALKPNKYHKAPDCAPCMPGIVWSEMVKSNEKDEEEG
ncbi:MAG: hypothetical protein IME99_00100 [Proteobacteria bacterium]|nr:hypothetical protein [Pseudomonadota bacterium]